MGYKKKNYTQTPPHSRITSTVCWQFIAYLRHKVTTQVQ